MSKGSRDNHANPLNPNNSGYLTSRGQESRPDDWEDQAAEENTEPSTQKA